MGRRADNGSDYLLIVGNLHVILKGKSKGESNKRKIESFDILNFKNFQTGVREKIRKVQLD